jgi:hypothetical protein
VQREKKSSTFSGISYGYSSKVISVSQIDPPEGIESIENDTLADLFAFKNTLWLRTDLCLQN